MTHCQWCLQGMRCDAAPGFSHVYELLLLTRPACRLVRHCHLRAPPWLLHTRSPAPWFGLSRLQLVMFVVAFYAAIITAAKANSNANKRAEAAKAPPPEYPDFHSSESPSAVLAVPGVTHLVAVAVVARVMVVHMVLLVVHASSCGS